MADQKRKKKFRQTFLAFFNVSYSKTHLITAFYCVDSSRSFGRLLENSKTGACRGLCLPESDFKTSSAVNFPKRHPEFGGPETNQRHEIQTRIFLHMLFFFLLSNFFFFYEYTSIYKQKSI